MIWKLRIGVLGLRAFIFWTWRPAKGPTQQAETPCCTVEGHSKREAIQMQGMADIAGPVQLKITQHLWCGPVAGMVQIHLIRSLDLRHTALPTDSQTFIICQPMWVPKSQASPVSGHCGPVLAFRTLPGGPEQTNGECHVTLFGQREPDPASTLCE